MPTNPTWSSFEPDEIRRFERAKERQRGCADASAWATAWPRGLAYLPATTKRRLRNMYDALKPPFSPR